MPTSLRTHRRQFLASTAAGVAAALLPPGSRAQERRRGPNDRINLGFIGIGMMGRGHLQSFLGNRDVQVVAVCDVHAGRAERRRARPSRLRRPAQGRRLSRLRAFADFRELLGRRDIDAVVIATPDHWHAIPAILAARAGKDIYCEKPLSLTIAEGRRHGDGRRATSNIVFQTGSQQRSEFGGHFRKAVEYVRSGRIGKVRTIRIGVGGPARPCDLPDEQTPRRHRLGTVERPARRRGFNHDPLPEGHSQALPRLAQLPRIRRRRPGRHGRPSLRHRPVGPRHGRQRPDRDRSARATGDTGLRFVYANGVEMFHGGTERLHASRGPTAPSTSIAATLSSTPADDPADAARRTRLPPPRRRQQPSPELARLHPLAQHGPVADVEIGARTAQICQLANIGYQLRRMLRWDPQTEEFVDNAEANRLRSRENRAPWNRV